MSVRTPTSPKNECSDLQYRIRLAETTRSIPDRLQQDCADLLALYGLDLTRDRDYVDVMGVDPLVDLLKNHPDLQSRLAQLTQYTTSKWLLEQELKASGAWAKDASGLDAYAVAADLGAVGVCFSGGGIRSATFNLGVLQGLAGMGKLKDIRYLSSVSGGGYIHHFLAAWVKRAGSKHASRDISRGDTAPVGDRRPGLEEVEEKLWPIPRLGSQRVIPPEPIRWLRRYSNYLSPSIDLLGPDVWTIAEIWIRNTMLNLVILVSFLMGILAIPRLFTTDRFLHWHPAYGFLVCLTLLALLAAAFSVCLLAYTFPRYVAAPENESANEHTRKERALNDRTRAWHALVLAWLVVSICLTPVLYRLSIPGGSVSSSTFHDATTTPEQAAAPKTQIVIKATGAKDALSSVTMTAEQGSEQPADKKRFQLAWRDLKPVCMLPHVPLPAWSGLSSVADLAPNCRSYKDTYTKHLLRNPVTLEETPLDWLFDAYPLLCAFFCGSIVASRKKTISIWGWLPSWLCSSLLGGAFAAVLVYAIQLLFFAIALMLPSENIPSLAIALLPSYLLAVPFIALELSTAFMGRLYASAHREWAARLRAVSFLHGSAWIVIGLISLLGPALMNKLATVAALKYTVWVSWIISTVSGILLGKSRSTSGNTKVGTTASDGKTFDVKEWIVKITPVIFVLGTFLLLSTVMESLLKDNDSHYPLERWAVLTFLCFAIALLFSWRIDVNEFSMNAFYRDRLARCYAGASNPQRVPNRFTGFDIDDASLRVAELLPKGWVDNGRRGDYEGPFPIFCTAINLTTGRDLAYQERKAGSFSFTPLYSGYSTGWTDGDSSALRYNGFLRTLEHIKPGKGITVASAVAISGAAASPNMGYHSNPAMAFLMTIFNVRLGWWIRNTRVPGSDYPKLGLFQLLKELRGHTDDTERFVYLSDGGHFENMGLHELLRRRCRRILVCDAEADGSLSFEGIGQAIRKARIDLGVEVKISGVLEKSSPATGSLVEETNDGKPSPEHPIGAEGLLQFEHFPGNLFHALEGEIIYPEDPERPGKLLYIKSILTGSEPSDILNYHRMHSNFPFDTTLNQFYTESQFESYRRLGEHIVCKSEIEEWIVSNLSPESKQR